MCDFGILCCEAFILDCSVFKKGCVFRLVSSANVIRSACKRLGEGML